MTERYMMGAKVNKGDIIAKVLLERDSRLISPTDDERDKFFNFKIKLIFDRIRQRPELEKLGINLNNYLRQGRSWIKQLNSNSELVPCLDDLRKLGFEIFDNENNKDYQKIVASIL